jgi:LPPG:FO 2-phospho-L-lactate transferase
VIVALAGGVGGARLAVGLAALLSPKQLVIVVNTGDDFEHLGLTVCPDLDTVMYTLAGINNPVAGWGRKDESWNFMETLGALGGATWFRLGDRDLAVHVLRTLALENATPLSDVTRALAARLGVRHAILPMSETPVRTRVRTDRGELSFQDYFVRLRCQPRVRGFRFSGARRATPPAALRNLLRDKAIEAAILCPSNPYVSIAPILAVPQIGAWMGERHFPVVAVSPIIGRVAVKGPAAKMMRELGREASALGVARHYGKLVDGWVIDTRDAKLKSAIEGEGKQVLVTDTLMTNRGGSARLAAATCAFAREIARGTGRPR